MVFINMKLHIPPNTYNTIASFMNIFDLREERQMVCFTCPDGSPPLPSDALLFPAPTLTGGKVREEDLYLWLRHVTLALEQEEVRALKQCSILAVYLEDEAYEAAQVVMDREELALSEELKLPDALTEDDPAASDELARPEELGLPELKLWDRLQWPEIPRVDLPWLEGPHVYWDFDDEEDECGN